MLGPANGDEHEMPEKAGAVPPQWNPLDEIYIVVRGPEELVAVLHASQLLPPDRFEEAKDLILGAPKGTGLTSILNRLVEQGLVTRWQASRLRDGMHQFRVGDYVLVDRLGGGGMGTVYKARHLITGQFMALKVVTPSISQHAQSLARFKREMQVAFSLEHPNIVATYDADKVGELHYLAMEYVDGRDLERWSSQHKTLPIGFACECVYQAAIGLQHIHEKGLIHRDLKPSNLIVTWGGGKGRPVVKILDLGLARFLPTAKRLTALTDSGQFLGTAAYVAPEQAFDPKSTDIRADIFSLACTLFKLLTGEIPFPVGTMMQTLISRSMRDADPLTRYLPDTPPELAAALAKALERNPEKRFQTPLEFAAALAPFREFSGHDLPPAPAGTLPPLIQHDHEWTEFPEGLPGIDAWSSTNTEAANLLARRGEMDGMPPPESDVASATQVPDVTPDAPSSWQRVVRGGRPTLIIGAGLLGSAVLERLRAQFPGIMDPDQHNVSFLLVDCDSNLLNDLDRLGSMSVDSKDELVFCPNPGAKQQRSGRGSAAGPFASTAGNRTWARQAILEHAAHVRSRLANILMAMAERYEPQRRPEIAVYILGAMGGGVGSGMSPVIVDLLRKEARAQKIAIRPHVVLFSGCSSGEPNLELRRANHRALLEEIEPAVAADSPEHLPDPESLEKPETAIIFDLESARRPDDVDSILDTATAFLHQSIATALGPGIDLGLGPNAYYRSLGMVIVESVPKAIIRQTACRIGSEIVSRALFVIPDAELDKGREALVVWLQTLFNSSLIATQMVQEVNSSLEYPIDEAVETLLEELERGLKAAPRHLYPRICQTTLDALATMFGPDPGDAGLPSPDFVEVVKGALNRVADGVVRAMIEALPASDRFLPSLSIMSWQREVCQTFFLKEFDIQRAEIIAGEELVKQAALTVRGKLTTLSRPGLRWATGTVATLVESVRYYALAKLRLWIRCQMASLLQVLRSKLTESQDEIVDVRKQLEVLYDTVQYEMSAAVYVPANRVVSMIYPGNASSPEEGIEFWYRRCLPEGVEGLKDGLGGHAFESLGRWQGRVSGDRLAPILLERIQSWLTKHMGAPDAAACYLEQVSIEEEEMEAAFRDLFQRAKPVSILADSGQVELGPVEERVWISVPPGQPGRLWRQAFQQAIPKVQIHPLTGESACVVCRVFTSNNWYRFIPRWLYDDVVSRQERAPIEASGT